MQISRGVTLVILLAVGGTGTFLSACGDSNGSGLDQSVTTTGSIESQEKANAKTVEALAESAARGGQADEVCPLFSSTGVNQFYGSAEKCERGSHDPRPASEITAVKTVVEGTEHAVVDIENTQSGRVFAVTFNNHEGKWLIDDISEDSDLSPF